MNSVLLDLKKQRRLPPRTYDILRCSSERTPLINGLPKIRFWKRYVDDVCCSLPGNEVSTFLLHMNSIEPSIQFTCEVEQDHVLPFLDVLLRHNPDGTITTNVYHKPTHTNWYLDYYSHHPSAHKSAVSRGEVLSSSSACHEHECSKIIAALESNNYPRSFLQKEHRADLSVLKKKSRPL